MEAVIWTDVAQVFVLLGGALTALVLMIAKIDGGFSGLLEMANEADKFHMMDWGRDATLPVVWVVVVGQICANLVPYTSDQTVIQRYLTTKTEAQARNAIWTNAFMTLPATLLFCGVGTALYGFYKTHPQNLDPTLQTDAIFPLFIVQELPPGVGGLVVAGIFAASMSSLDSSMNSLATVVTTDFYRRFKGPTDEQRTLVLARVLTAFFGVLGTGVALLMATFDIKSFMDLYIKLLGFIGGSLAGLFALGVFSKRANGPGALLGAIAGAAMVAFVQTYYPVHFFLNATISMGTCMVVGYVLSFVFTSGREGTPNGYH
jgi:SSS family transporter